MYLCRAKGMSANAAFAPPVANSLRCSTPAIRNYRWMECDDLELRPFKPWYFACFLQLPPVSCSPRADPREYRRMHTSGAMGPGGSAIQAIEKPREPVRPSRCRKMHTRQTDLTDAVGNAIMDFESWPEAAPTSRCRRMLISTRPAIGGDATGVIGMSRERASPSGFLQTATW